VIDQVSHPYSTTGKITVLYIVAKYFKAPRIGSTVMSKINKMNKNWNRDAISSFGAPSIRVLRYLFRRGMRKSNGSNFGLMLS
jgi:hypothetical protein